MNALARDIEYAANHVRTANHSTMRGPLTAPETYDVVGNLVELTQRLPQVVDFLARSLRRADPGEHVDDRGADPTDALCQASADISDAGYDLDQLVRRLASAHNHLGHLGRVPTEED